jgi:hypothetical protein
MQWTQKKPTVEGDYWVGWHWPQGFAATIQTCGIECDDENVLCWLPAWDEGPDWTPVDEYDDDTWYYGPVTAPEAPNE